MKCTNCGKEIPNDSYFCEYCGTSLHCHKSKDKNPLWNKLTVVLLLCVIVFGVAFCYEHFQYKSVKEKLGAIMGASSRDPDNPIVITDGYGVNNENDVDVMILQRDSLLLEVNKLKDDNKKLRRRVDELDEENGYLTTDVRLAREALEDCMGR